jgi:Ammonium Transporter Family
LSGLVAITAGCGVIDYWAALIIGTLSGAVYIGADALLIYVKIDDAVAAIPVHLANGLWGILSVGLFANPTLLMEAYGKNSHAGLFFSGFGDSLLPAHIVGILFITAWTFVTMGPFFIALDYMGWFRVNELEELVGLDATYNMGAPSGIGDDEASDNEDVRLAAYRQRFEERKHLREHKPVKTMTVDALLNESFFGPASTVVPSGGAGLDGVVAEQPMRKDKLSESCDL